MFNPIIETAIGLMFVYLLLSMICSAIQEWIAALLALRAQTLFNGITNLLCQDNNLRDQIFKNPLVKGLSRKSWLDSLLRRDPRPSYISAETFSKAFLTEANVGLNLQIQDGHEAKNGQPLHANTRDLLKSLLGAAPADFGELRKSVEQWYNDGMDRVSGWYKRKTQLIIVILGLVVATFLNADTFMLAKAFWNDPVLRAKTAAAAAQWVKTHNRPEPSSTPTSGGASPAAATAHAGTSGPASSTAKPKKTGTETKPSKEAEIADLYPSVTWEEDQSPPPTEQPYTPEQKERAEQQYRDAEANLLRTSNEALAQLQELKVPLGWCSVHESDDEDEEGITKASETSADGCDPDHSFPASTWQWWLKLGGLLVTMLAISQGAPFWFDLLKTFVNLRLAGDAPDEKKKK